MQSTRVGLFTVALLAGGCWTAKEQAPGCAEIVILPTEADVLTETWRAAEITFESAKVYAEPLNDAELTAVFTSPSGRAYTVPGFWDGGRTWRVRFAPPECGVWTFVTVCTDSSDGGLHGKTGTLGSNRYQGALEIYRRGFIRTAPGVRHFMYADGTPFFYLGDTHWSMPREPFDEMFTCIVDKRVAQGFTVYQSEPLGAKVQFADGLGEADLPGLQDLDRRFKYIADAGLVHANAQLFFPPEITRPCYTDAYLKKLCRLWVARFGAYPVLWTAGQEVDNDFYFDRGDKNHFDATSNPWKRVLAWVHEYDPYRHPGTAHMEFLGGKPEPETFPPKNERPKYGYGVQASTSSFRDVPGHTWWAVQWTPPQESGIYWLPVKGFWEDGQGKPVVNYEGSYDHLWTLGDGARQQGWTAYLNGMFGHGYGAIDIWLYQSTYDMEKDTVRGSLTVTVEQKKTPWTTSVEFPSARELGIHMKGFFASREWWRLTPRFDDRKWFIPENTAWYSLATIDSELYVLYLYNRTTTATGTLCNLRDTAYTARWFDPRTGTYQDLETFTPRKTASNEDFRWPIPAKPSAADWVLVVRREFVEDPVTVGAIRWDAWHTPAAVAAHGGAGGPVRAMEASLNPHRYRWRAPFFARVDADDTLRIDGYTQEILDREIAYAKAGGIDYWAFLLYDEGNCMSQGLSLYLSSARRRDVNFCAVASPNTFGGRNGWDAGIARLLRYMREPNYQTVAGGRPLLFLFRPDEKWIQAWGGPAGARGLIDALRAAAKAAELGEPYIVVMDSGAAESVKRTADLFGAQAISDYARQRNAAGGSYADLCEVARSFSDACAATGAEVVPLAMAGWDRRPRVEHPVPWEKWQKPGAGLDRFYMLPTPEELAAHVGEAMAWVEARPAQCSAQTVIVYAWNEHDEGGWLCPTLGENGKPDASRLEAISRMRRARTQRKTKQ